MAKLFLILTIIASIAALAFGYMTKDKVATIQASITEAKKEAADANTQLNKKKDELKAAQQQTAAVTDQLNTAKADTASAKSAADAATKAQADLQAKVDDLTKKLADATAAQPPKPEQAGATPEQIQELQKKVADAEAKAQEATQLLQTQSGKLKDDEDRIQTLTKEEARRKSVLMVKGLEGQVMAVNQGWNFVVVSIGDRQGAVPNAQLIVKRDDHLIARLKISSVEPATSIADILPDSVPKGERVLPGDRVIFPGQ
jgi:chromosome segregation ATPase